jgi:hypothetical protein
MTCVLRTECLFELRDSVTFGSPESTSNSSSSVCGEWKGLWETDQRFERSETDNKSNHSCNRPSHDTSTQTRVTSTYLIPSILYDTLSHQMYSVGMFPLTILVGSNTRTLLIRLLSVA